MGESVRQYVYGITEEGSQEFLHTFLTSSDALSYIKSHAKVFPKRYKEYQYGYQSQPREECKVYG